MIFILSMQLYLLTNNYKKIMYKLFIEKLFNIFLKKKSIILTIINIVLCCFCFTQFELTLCANIKHENSHNLFFTNKSVNKNFPYKRDSSYKNKHHKYFANFAGGQMLPSHADNFHGAWSTSVNPRTGKASFSINISTLLFNYSKKRSLSLTYAGAHIPVTFDTFGLGSQWRWNVATEHESLSEIEGRETTDIITSSGQSLTMENEMDAAGILRWRPLRHKLKDVIVQGRPGDWTVTTFDLREHIKNGYEDWEEDEKGDRVWFYYDNSHNLKTRRLIYICSHQISSNNLFGMSNACKDQGVRIKYGDNLITVYGNQIFKIHQRLDDGLTEVDSIEMPSLSSDQINYNENSYIKFTYDINNNLPWLLHQITMPEGYSTVFLYNTESDRRDNQTAGLSTGNNGVRLPVVTEEITHYFNKNIPDKRIWFYYDEDGSGHNYTGYQEGHAIEPGRDNLLDCPDDYTYSVAQNNGFTKTTTTYNKYHLPLTVIQKADKNQRILGKTEHIYEPWKRTTFETLAANYSFPIKSIKKIYSKSNLDTDQNLNVTEINQNNKYNNSGQIVWKKDAWGREKFIQYCPPKGDAHCPASNNGWLRTDKPEKIIVIPAKIALSKNNTNRYFSEPENLNAYETVINYKSIPIVNTNKQNKQEYTEHSSSNDLWVVDSKITGVVPKMLLTKLTPGDSLPESDSSKLINKSNYIYNNNNSSPFYNKLVQINITTYKASNFNDESFSFLNSAGNQIKEIASVKVNYKIDLKNNIRSVSRFLYKKSYPENSQFRSFSDYKGIQLGTDEYSLKTGLKFASINNINSHKIYWTYDNWFRPIKKIETAKGGFKDQVTTWSYIFTKGEHSIIKTDPNGNKVKIIFGPDKQVLSSSHLFNTPKNSHGVFVGWIPDMKATYTPTGKLASQTVWLLDDSINGKSDKALNFTKRFGYDSMNRQVWEKNPSGSVAFSIYDDQRNMIIYYKIGLDTKQQYKKVFPLIRVVESNILGLPSHIYKISFNPKIKKNGKFVYSQDLQTQLMYLLKSIKPISELKQVDSYGLVSETGSSGLLSFIHKVIAEHSWLSIVSKTYDRYGHIQQRISANGATTNYHWNNNSIDYIVNPNKSTVHDEYDIQGNKTARYVKPFNSKIFYKLGLRSFNAQGSIVSQAALTGKKSTFTYDESGRLLTMKLPSTQQYPSGNIFSWKYNAIGVEEVDLNNKPQKKYFYDKNTWKMTDEEDTTIHLHYDYDKVSGNLIKITRSKPQNLKTAFDLQYPTGTIVFGRNLYNNITTYKDIFNNIYMLKHDKFDRVIQKSIKLHNQQKFTVLSSVQYDSFGRIEQAVNGIGIKRVYTYGDIGLPVTVIDTYNGALLSKLIYQWNLTTGNLTSYTQSNGKYSATQVYDYDIDDNLKSMSCSATKNKDAISYFCPRDTDFTGSTFKQAPIIQKQEYTFDNWNNIASVKEQLHSSNQLTLKTFVTKNTKYTYSLPQASDKSDIYNPHQLTMVNTQWSDANCSDKPKHLFYDNGQLVTDINSNKLHYDPLGHLISFENIKTHQTTHYIYDGNGHQVATWASDDLTKKEEPILFLLYKNNSVFAQIISFQGKITHYSVELGVAHIDDGAITKWYLHNYKGDVIKEINNKSYVIKDNVYSPYGMVLSLNNPIDSNLNFSNFTGYKLIRTLGFDNQMEDSSTKYQFLGEGYRAYNPNLKHFITQDSFSPFKVMDGYGFAKNNPIMNTDPSGHMSKDIGYIFGALEIGTTVALSILMPVAAGGFAGLIGASEVSAGIIAAGFSAASVGLSLASGSLQIASTALSNNKKLGIANMAFGIASGIASFSEGGLTTLFGASEAIGGGAKLLSKKMASLLATSSFSAMVGSGLGSVSASMTLASTLDANIRKKTSFMKALEDLTYISMGFMVTSMMGNMIVGSDIISGLHVGKEAQGTIAEDITDDGSAESQVTRMSEDMDDDQNYTPNTRPSQILSSDTADIATIYEAYGIVSRILDKHAINVRDENVNFKPRFFKINKSGRAALSKVISKVDSEKLTEDLFNGKKTESDIVEFAKTITFSPL